MSANPVCWLSAFVFLTAIGVFELLPTPAFGQDVWKGGAGNWSNGSMWSTGVPTSTSNVEIDNGNPKVSPVTLDVQGQANTFTLDSDDSLSFNNGTSLTINGNTINNAGNISLNSAGSLTELFVANGATLSGAGTVTLSNNSQNAVDGNSGATLTNQSTIQGVGQIGPHFTLTNKATIDANVSGAALLVSQQTGATDTNTATMEATNGGILQLATGGSSSINNAGGTIKAAGANSQVQLSGQGTTINSGTLTTSSGGTIVVPAGTSVTLNGVTNGGTLDIQNNATTNPIGMLTNNGTINVNSAGNLTYLFLANGNVTLAGKGRVVLNNNINSALDGNGGLVLTNKSTIQGGGTIGPHFTFTNNGTLLVTAANTLNINGPFTNFAGSTLTGGTYSVTGTFQFTNASIVTNSANITLSGSKGQIVNQGAVNALANFGTNTSAASFTVTGGQQFTTTLSGAFSNAGKVTVGKSSTFTVACNANFQCPYTQTAGTTTVDGTLTDSLFGVQIQGGNLLGTGKIAAAVTSSGAVTAGDALTKAGVLSPGTYTQNANGSLNIQIGGTMPGTQYSQLAVTNGASLNGTLNLKLINHFVPAIGAVFTILTGSAISGTFSTVNGKIINSGECFQTSYGATTVTLTVQAGTGCT